MREENVRPIAANEALLVQGELYMLYTAQRGRLRADAHTASRPMNFQGLLLSAEPPLCDNAEIDTASAARLPLASSNAHTMAKRNLLRPPRPPSMKARCNVLCAWPQAAGCAIEAMHMPERRHMSSSFGTCQLQDHQSHIRLALGSPCGGELRPKLYDLRHGRLHFELCGNRSPLRLVIETTLHVELALCTMLRHLCNPRPYCRMFGSIRKQVLHITNCLFQLHI